MEVDLKVTDHESLDTLSGFAAWLQNNGNLVKDLVVYNYLKAYGHQHGSKTANCVLAQGMSLANASGAPLAMQSYRALVFADRAIWLILPARTLVHLKVTLLLTQAREAAFTECFQQCTNLQSLDVVITAGVEGQRGTMQQVPPNLLQSFQGLANLRHLTLFTGDNCSWSSLQALPPSLQTLSLTQGRWVPGCKVDIAHLHNLQKLCVTSPTGFAEGSCLPAALLSLNLSHTPIPEAASSFFRGVQELALEYPPPQPLGMFRQLADIQSLKQLSMLVEPTYTALEASTPSIWRHLSQLKELTFDIITAAVGDRMLAGLAPEPPRILKDLAAATSLTSLRLDLSSTPILFYGSCVAQLSNLRELALANGRNSSRTDGMCLAKLTGLTRLQMQDCTMDDATAVAVLVPRQTCALSRWCKHRHGCRMIMQEQR
jgi:hypothetical protein